VGPSGLIGGLFEVGAIRTSGQERFWIRLTFVLSDFDFRTASINCIQQFHLICRSDTYHRRANQPDGERWRQGGSALLCSHRRTRDANGRMASGRRPDQLAHVHAHSSQRIRQLTDHRKGRRSRYGGVHVPRRQRAGRSGFFSGHRHRQR